MYSSWMGNHGSGAVLGRGKKEHVAACLHLCGPRSRDVIIGKTDYKP